MLNAFANIVVMLRTWPEKSSLRSAAAVLDGQMEVGRAKKFSIQTGPPGFWVLNEIEKDKRIQRSIWAVLLNNHIKSSIIYNTLTLTHESQVSRETDKHTHTHTHESQVSTETDKQSSCEVTGRCWA